MDAELWGSMDDLDWSIAYEGHKLSGFEAETLERDLETFPQDPEIRLKLLGYYSEHYYCCEDASERRNRHIAWLFENVPAFDASLTPLMYIHLLDRAAYSTVKSIVKSALASCGDNARVYSNVAALVRPHDPQWARKLLERAIQLDPANVSLLQRLEELHGAMPILIENKVAFQEMTGSFVNPQKCSHRERKELG